MLAGIDSDPLVMPSAESAKLPLPVVVTARETCGPVSRSTSVPALQASIDATKAAVNQANPLLALRADLPDILKRVDTQARAAQVLILVTGVQALFLAIFALVIVVQRVGRARAAEWSVGRLRGRAPAPLVGLDLHRAAGRAAARPAARLPGRRRRRPHGCRVCTLRPGTPVEPWRWPVVASAVGATVLAVGALVAVSLRSLRQPLADLIQTQAEARRLGVLGAVVHAVVFVLAAASVYQLLSGGLLSASGTQLGSAGPGSAGLGGRHARRPGGRARRAPDHHPAAPEPLRPGGRTARGAEPVELSTRP